MSKFLAKTPLLDYDNPMIIKLIFEKQWNVCDENEKILGIYDYVRDTVSFGYNKADAIPASQVLKDGFGQCNTKGILFMALLRAVGIPCRLHGFTVDKKMQKGAVRGLFYRLAPREILHCWIEVFYNNAWINLEGIILDAPYLTSLQKRFKDCTGSFCGYGVATNTFQNPSIDWNQTDTFIQKEGIIQDLGTYDSPDIFYERHHQNLGRCKEFLYRYVVRHLMNRNIRKIRKRG